VDDKSLSMARWVTGWPRPGVWGTDAILGSCCRARLASSKLLSAAELLESRGWQAIGVDAGGKLICLRRVRR
jgi:hypothetical protein